MWHYWRMTTGDQPEPQVPQALPVRQGLPAQPEPQVRLELRVQQALPVRQGPQARQALPVQPEPQVPQALPAPQVQIGRASCRDRVESTVGAGALKTKRVQKPHDTRGD